MLTRSLLRIAALIVAAIAIHRFCVVPYRDNLLVGDVAGRSTLAQNADPAEATSLATTNIRELERAEEGRRLDPNWYLLYGANCELADRWHDAEIAYTRALRIDNRPEIYVNRGLVLLHLGRTSEGEADLATAARFDPGVLNNLDELLRARVAAAAGLH